MNRRSQCPRHALTVLTTLTASSALASAEPQQPAGILAQSTGDSSPATAVDGPTEVSEQPRAVPPANPAPPTHPIGIPSEPIWSVPIAEASVLFTGMRVTEAYLWPNPFSFHRIDDWPLHYEQAFTLPPKFDSSRPFMTWDGDRWQINVFGHGLLGSELYVRPRRCGFGVLGSLGFATVASAVWEYGFEANGVRPSGVDLWYTPLSGLLLGEARFQAWRAASSIRRPALRHMVRALVDPVGQFSSELLDQGCSFGTDHHQFSQ